MSLAWGARLSSFLRSGKNLQIGWVITALVVALYAGAFRPQERRIGINNSKASGLAAFEQRSEPLGLWRDTRFGASVAGAPSRASVDRVPLNTASFLAPTPQAEASSANAEADRKMVRTMTVEMLVQHPAETAEKMRVLAEQEGGFLVSSEVHGQQDPNGGTLSIRVPAERFESVRLQIRRVGLMVESERIDAQDVTRQFADQEANLRNLKAEEQRICSF